MPPLADVARQAEAAKTTTKKATKTYTNSNLSSDARRERAPAPTPAPTSGLVSKSPGKLVAAEEMPGRSDAKAEDEAIGKESEATWRMRAASLRKQIDQLRARLTELTTSDAPRAESPAVRALNGSDIANTRASLDGLRKQWARLEASARERKIPLSWIEPLPTFPQ